MKTSVTQLFARKALVTALASATLCGSVGFISSAYAQETTAVIRGIVTDMSGDPVQEAEVTITSEGTGITRTVTTDENGSYYVRNLPAGVAYTITADAPGLQKAITEEQSLTVGQTAILNYALSAEEEVLVVAQAIQSANTAIGPNAVFDLQTLQDSPSVNRNINDIIQQDPRLYVDQSRGDVDAVQCNGANPRYNSLTVDGIRLNDGFGLNSNGYPTQRMPFPYDAISSVAVELAPMSVVYGGFSACNINAVTKTGRNEIFGSVFLDYGSDSLRGDKLEGDSIESQDYEETRWGFELGGAIIKDKLFFYGAYEKYDGADLNERGALGTGAVNEVPVTQAELDQIAQIARDVYGFDPGRSVSEVFDFEDEKYLAKIDWYATDKQRLAVTYMYNDSFNFTPSDGDLDEFEFDKHFYKRGAELTSYNFTLYSDWTDNFSTEIRYSLSEVDFLQQSVAGKDFAEMRVELDEVDVYLGQDDSRQANDLNYDIEQLVIRGTYVLGNHSITAGYETESTDVYNLFYQHTDTEIRFDGIDNFAAGQASRVYYGNALTNNELDAAVSWEYSVDTLYIEDQWQVNDRLNVTLGLRYEEYSTSDRPTENPDFVADYGFSNSATLDGVDLLMPRVGFTYDLTDAITIRGGAGLFSGGNPNVWYSNVYSNTNTAAVQVSERGVDLFAQEYVQCESSAPVCGPGWGIPAGLASQVAAGDGSNFEIVYLDPNFEAPSEWKYSLGMTWELDNGFVLTADAQITRGKDTAIYKHGDLDFTGEYNDFGNGYPVYDSPRVPTFVLTNSGTGNESESIAVGLFKSYDFGLDMTLGYAWSDAKDVNPMTSSVAFSNYTNRAFYDPEEEVLATSNYNIEHRFTAVFNYTAQWWGDYATRFSLFAQSSSGVPYSLVLGGADGTIGAYGFTPYLDFIEHVLIEPGTRNNQEGSWWTKADLRISQEFPGFSSEHRGSAFLIIDNFTNLLNDDWGVMERPNFPYGVTIEDRDAGRAESRIGDASLWEIRVGVNYRF
jgi:outer membrane receptor for ferrienterochelin and colicin